MNRIAPPRKYRQIITEKFTYYVLYEFTHYEDGVHAKYKPHGSTADEQRAKDWVEGKPTDLCMVFGFGKKEECG